MSALTDTAGSAHRHAALLYRGEEEFVARTAAFLRAGLEAGEEVLAAVSPEKFGLLSDALGEHAGDLGFLDMTDVGRNPGRLISAWHDFVSQRPGRTVRGVGEPVSMDRTPEELAECDASEALWNLAFADRDVWVVCPFDAQALPPDYLDTVGRTHSAVLVDGVARPSEQYDEPWASVLSGPLPEPETVRTTLPFGPLHGQRRPMGDAALHTVRAVVGDAALRAGATRARAQDLVIAVNEIAGNSIRHGGGAGVLRVWDAPGGVVCEVRDRGRLTDPLAGRLRPSADRPGGRGLWMAHHLCDLVQIRSGDDGTVVRLHLRTGH